MSCNPILIMRLCFALLIMLALPLSAQAQTALDGAWTLSFLMQEGASQELPLDAETVQDTLRLTISSDHGTRAIEDVSFNDDVLKFLFDTGHGAVNCTLYRKEESDDLSGICEGSMGEIPTTMKRRE